MTVTAHFLTDKIKMVSRVLCTLAVEVRHTAENLADHLKSVTANWRIPSEKICGVVSDNAANVRKAIVTICRWRHIQCFAHTLSLAVKDAIHDNVEFSGIILYLQ